MKILILITSVAFFTACNNEHVSKSINSEAKKIDTIYTTATILDSNLWIDDFRNFRDAVYKRDIEKVKSYFDFPIKKQGEGIWYFANNDSYAAGENGITRKFTEKEFVKYFDKIFDKDFITALLKIKTEELAKKNETQTAEIREGKYRKYFMTASVDSSKTNLGLNFDVDDAFIQENGDIDPMEFNTILVFDILKYKKIKYRLFTFAG